MRHGSHAPRGARRLVHVSQMLDKLRRQSPGRMHHGSWSPRCGSIIELVDDLSPEAALLAADTTAAAESRQLAAFRRLSSTEKAELVAITTRAVLDLALAGIRLRHPGADERECFLRLAAIRLGRNVAASIYPDLRQLPDSSGAQPD
jgi:hypothetical protein